MCYVNKDGETKRKKNKTGAKNLYHEENKSLEHAVHEKRNKEALKTELKLTRTWGNRACVREEEACLSQHL